MRRGDYNLRKWNVRAFYEVCDREYNPKQKRGLSVVLVRHRIGMPLPNGKEVINEYHNIVVLKPEDLEKIKKCKNYTILRREDI